MASRNKRIDSDWLKKSIAFGLYTEIKIDKICQLYKETNQKQMEDTTTNKNLNTESYFD